MPGRRPTRGRTPGFEACEPRELAALVFVLNGAGFAKTGPDSLTAGAAKVLQHAGNRVVQLSNAAIGTAGAFQRLAAQVQALGRGRTIALVGFSAGGALAERLSAIPSLHVSDVLSYYGVPDLRDYFQYHQGDSFYRAAYARVHFTDGVIDLLSGPSATTAHVVAAFGQQDPGVTAAQSTASFLKDFPGGDVYTYPGAHGVPIQASPAALEDFLAHLAP